MDYLVYIIVRGIFLLLRILPYNFALWLLGRLVLLVMCFLPKHRRVALRNLEIAFPESNLKWREKIFRESCISIARLVLDFTHLPSLSNKWIQENIDLSDLDKYGIKSGKKPDGLIYATGHLGSFELLACIMACQEMPLTFVARNFKNQYVDRWWNARRQMWGNKAISRKGAFAQSVKTLGAGEDLAILFDQNVTIKHAVFVDFFGFPAATTKTPAILALRKEAPVVAISLQHLHDRKYKVNLAYCDFKDIYGNPELSAEEKIQKITQKISKEYEEMIRQDPGAWFWMHRRWRTRPLGDTNNPYQK